jgi:hypothetical protein
LECFCPLCRSDRVVEFFEDRLRCFLRCEICRLVFVPREFHLSPGEEKAQYDHHENSPDDLGYRKFLGRLFEPVNTRLLPGRKGLDFGSGPGPTLSVMFEEAGHCVSLYDPFYAPDAAPLNRQYDFVTASEVVEHFCEPAKDLQRLWSCVKPGTRSSIVRQLALQKRPNSRQLLLPRNLLLARCELARRADLRRQRRRNCFEIDIQGIVSAPPPAQLTAC